MDPNYSLPVLLVKIAGEAGAGGESGNGDLNPLLYPGRGGLTLSPRASLPYTGSHMVW